MEWLGYIYITRTHYSSYCLHYQSNLRSDKKVLDKSKIILDNFLFICYTNNRKRKEIKKMTYLNLIAELNEAIENGEIDQFDEVDFAKLVKLASQKDKERSLYDEDYK